MQPLALAPQVSEEYRRYIETSFPILDDELRRQVAEKIEHEHLLWKGPYVSLSRPFTRGKAVRELVEEGVLARETERIFTGWTLYDHQERATRRLAQAEPTIVASSTGSGKTESFLIPIIDYCLRHKREPGTKAVLIYPMNALANDQLKRLRRLLAGSGITFARYTGDTQRDAVVGTERPEGVPDEECLSREQIQAHPPDILITNYAMLELLLVRREDQRIFRDRRVHYLVMDEVHTYGGARGIEVACLIRRFKEHIGCSQGGLVCVGTSATVKGEDVGEVADFASKLFAEPFTSEAIIMERFDKPQVLRDPYWPPLPELAEDALESFDPLDEERAIELAERLCGRRAEAEGNGAERLWKLFEHNALLRHLEGYLDVPRALDELVTYVKALPERQGCNEHVLTQEITAYLLLGAQAMQGDQPRLRPKVHIFYRGLEGFTRCLHCRSIWEANMDTCPNCHGCCLPVEICRSCGQDFWRGNTEKELIRGEDYHLEGVRTAYIAPDNSRESSRSTLHLTFEIQRAIPLMEDDDDEESDTEQEEAEVKPKRVKATSKPVPVEGTQLSDIYVCTHCGWATLELPPHGACGGTLPSGAACEGELTRMRYHGGKLSQCPACRGRYGTREIVTTFGTSVAASVSVLTSSTMKRLDEQERRLLIFSDNRQDTAFQAGYLSDKHGQFTKRQLIYQVIDEEASLGRPPVGLADLPVLLYNYGVRIGLFEKARREREREERIKAETWPILAEFARGGSRRVSLEGLGLLKVRYHGLREELAESDKARQLAAAWKLSEEEFYALAATVLDEMRTRRALDHELLKTPIPFREVEVEGFDRDLRPIGYGEVGVPKDHAYKIRPLANKKGAPSQLQAYLRKLFAGSADARQSAEAVVQLAEVLQDLDYLRETVIGKAEDHHKALMVDHERIELLPVRPGESYECDACRRVYTYSVRGVCPAMHCQGRLRPLRTKDENYYVHSYLERKLITLKPHEHSGQLDGKTREQYEEEFRRGSVNVLVCTPTMELGVDIGDLPVVMMRNIPPGPANYAQRSGRAGRAKRIALIEAFAQNRGHDSYYYDKPAEMIRGIVSPPVFGFDNKRIIRRHIHALILEKLENQLPALLQDVVDENDRVTGIERHINELTGRRKVVQEAVASAFARDIAAGGLPWLNEDYVSEVIDAFPTELERAFRPWIIERRSIIDELNSIPSVRPTQEQKRRREVLDILLYKLERDPMRAYPLSYLAKQGFLPAYAFGGDNARMVPLGETRDPLTRAQDVALVEFAPGNLVYCDGSVYTIRGLDFQRSDTPEYDMQYRLCPRCQFVTLTPSAQYCENCQSELTKYPYVEARSFIGIKSRSITAAEETRASEGYDAREYLLDEGGTGAKRVGPAGFDLVYHRNASILAVNTGFFKGNVKAPQGFFICTICGQWWDPHQEGWEQKHRKKCTGAVRNFHLAYKLETDVLEIEIPEAILPAKERASFWITLRNALVLGANLALETEESEIAGFERVDAEEEERARVVKIILYDDVPGGAGYVERLARMLPEAAAAALERLEQCECVNSCYRCLRSYHNQGEHRHLNKKLVLEVLTAMADTSSQAAAD